MLSFMSTIKPVLSGHSKQTPNIGFQYRLSLNGSQKYCRMLKGEHSVILLTFIKLPFPLRPLFCLFFKWPLKTGFTVLYFLPEYGIIWVVTKYLL